jgi:tetratricopeptide (TPR) repeat protein
MILLGALALASLWASRPRPPARRTDRQLAALAEQAEDRLIALGSHAGGMAATEWFQANEKALYAAVQGRGRPAPTDSVDDLARICNALDAWYVRERRGAALLALAGRQDALAAQTGRHDLAEIAAARTATAHRMLGDLDEANSWLGTSEGVAPRGRTAAALQVRRQVEWGLQHLARADRRRSEEHRKDEVQTARDRLDEAASLLPRADVDADLAVRINLGLVCLYRGEPDPALEHLLLAAARAHQVRNAGLQAHATELAGVAAWMQGNRPQAEAWWNEAMRLYADIDDRQGRGRCLQHLGSAAQARGDAATAVPLLEESIRLRDGAGQLAARYLAVARGRLEADGTEPGRPERRARLTTLIHRLFQWLFRR